MDSNTQIAGAGKASGWEGAVPTQTADVYDATAAFANVTINCYITAVVFECFRLHLLYSVRSPQLICSIIGGKNIE